MTAEPAARPAPKLVRDRQLAMYARACESLPGGTDSNFRAWGERHGLRRPRQGRHGVGPATATSTSTCGWAMAR